MKTLKGTTWWIYVLAAAAMLPSLILRDFTPDNELRYMSIADEALEQGSVWCFSNHGEAYADKPPLYLWIVMVGRYLFGQNCMWFLGLFSLVPMLAVGRIMDGWARSRLNIRRRQTALLMLFTCGYFPGLALTLRMDMLMTLWIVLALREVYRMDQGVPTRRHEALLGLYTFLALFTKGPFGVIFPLLGSVVYLVAVGRVRLIRRIWGWPAWAVLLSGCGVWFGCVFAEGGAAYIDNLLFHQTIDRAANAFTHQRPWWYYVVHMWYIMAPWSLIIAYEAVANRKTIVRGDFRKMMLSVFLTCLFAVSCVSSKLQVYLLPAIPFFVYLGATFIAGEALMKVIKVFAVGVLAVLFGASWFMPVLNPSIGYGVVCKEVSALNPAEVWVDASVRRGENIDAYFSVPVRLVNSVDSVISLPKNVVLLLPGSKGEKLTYKTGNEFNI